MFAKSIVLSDDFLDMPATARCLYFTLNMLADDDGFVNSPRSIMRQCMATQDDMKILLMKCYLIPFDSGIVVIRHWRINNYLRSDRYRPTKFLDEKAQLYIDESGAYGKIERPEPLEIESGGTAQLFPGSGLQEQACSEPVKAEAPRKKAVPLVDREPRNELEEVEKAYLLNYRALYEQGVLRSESPIVNWAASRKITKESIKKYGLSAVLEAVRKSRGDDFCIAKGYCLTTILSSGVLAGLVNGAGRSPPRLSLAWKYDMSELAGG